MKDVDGNTSQGHYGLTAYARGRYMIVEIMFMGEPPEEVGASVAKMLTSGTSIVALSKYDDAIVGMTDARAVQFLPDELNNQLVDVNRRKCQVLDWPAKPNPPTRSPVCLKSRQSAKLERQSNLKWSRISDRVDLATNKFQQRG